MKKFLYLGITTLFLSATVKADFYAGAGLGMGVNGGKSRLNNLVSSYKDSGVLSLNGGYELPLPLFDIRGEVEVLRTRPETKDGRTKQLDGLFLNAYADIPLIPIVDPYVGLGLGRVRYDHSNSYAFQGMLGGEYELPFAPVSIAGEYRYLKINERSGKSNATSKFYSNILMFKARYSF